ncbi:MAG: branched-chain amino acid ABC transporter permease [Anaerolineae bacterium]
MSTATEALTRRQAGPAIGTIGWTLRKPSFWVVIGLLIIVGLLPLVTGNNTLRESMFTVLMFAGLAASLNILMGYTGYVNFGNIVFFGLGGYVGFYVMSALGWNLFPALLVGGLAAGSLAALLGLALLRLRGAYFALATIGVNEAARAFVANFEPFGAATGMHINFGVYNQYGGAASALQLSYILMLILAIVVACVSFFVKDSRLGHGLFSIREDEDAATVMGVNPWRYKTIAYVLSAIFPGIIGVIFFFKNGNIEPLDAFPFQRSLEVLVMVMLGGNGTVLGPMLGAGIYQEMRGFLLTNDLFKNLQLAFAGLALLLIVLFVPAGLVGWIRGRFPVTRRWLE